jgi:DNA-binding phage protein
MVRSKLLETLKVLELESVRQGNPQRWSVARIARETGLARSTIDRLMVDPGACSVATVEAIAQVLGVSFDDLLEVEPLPERLTDNPLLESP